MVRFLFLSLLFLTACSARGPRMEVISTSKDADLEEIEAQSTHFKIAVDKDYAAWQRVKVFFQEYLGNDVSPDSNKSYYATTEDASRDKKYFYAVRRQTLASGDKAYSVECYALNSGSPVMAERNAKNLARFIESGKLQVSLLDQ